MWTKLKVGLVIFNEVSFFGSPFKNEWKIARYQLTPPIVEPCFDHIFSKGVCMCDPLVIVE